MPFIQPRSPSWMNCSKQIVDIAPTPPSRVVGPQLAADIIGYFDSNVEAEVLDRLTEEDEDMGNHVRDLMFIFDNLLSVTDRDMQRLLKKWVKKSWLLP